tara:strand:- start:403 stop:582 length:180 start_codon:yes stop_codon:yes gene_type:complete
MSKIKNAIDNFLDSGGEHLGYSEYDLPDIDDFDTILRNGVKVWEYHGKTEIEYYGGNDE